MKPLTRILVGVFVAVLASGCAGTAPVQNINQSIAGNHSEVQVRRAILYAGLNRGWIINPVSEGVIDGKILLRGHRADIRIYVGSNNMDAKEGKLHSNYNRWEANLNKDIQLELARQNIK